MRPRLWKVHIYVSIIDQVNLRGGVGGLLINQWMWFWNPSFSYGPPHIKRQMGQNTLSGEIDCETWKGPTFKDSTMVRTFMAETTSCSIYYQGEEVCHSQSISSLIIWNSLSIQKVPLGLLMSKHQKLFTQIGFKPGIATKSIQMKKIFSELSLATTTDINKRFQNTMKIKIVRLLWTKTCQNTIISVHDMLRISNHIHNIINKEL